MTTSANQASPGAFEKSAVSSASMLVGGDASNPKKYRSARTTVTRSVELTGPVVEVSLDPLGL